MQFIVEHLPAGAVYANVRTEAISVNRAVEEITGYTAAELATLQDWFNLLFGEHSTTVRREYEQARRSQFEELQH